MDFDESMKFLMEQQGWTMKHENKLYLLSCDEYPNLNFVCSTRSQLVGFYDGLRLGKKQVEDSKNV